MRSAERMKVNVLEMKCLRSLVGVPRMDRVRNEEVRRRAGIEMELASRADRVNDRGQPFDRVNHQGILYWLSSVGIGGSVLSVLTQFLSNRSQFVFVDGCCSKLVSVVSGVLHGSVLSPLLFLLYTSGLFSFLENKLIGYADDSTLIAVVPSAGARVTVAEFLNRDLVRVNAWCDLWGMKLNEGKTKTMIVSMSRTMHSQSPPLTIDGTVLKESDDLDIF